MQDQVRSYGAFPYDRVAPGLKQQVFAPLGFTYVPDGQQVCLFINARERRVDFQCHRSRLSKRVSRVEPRDVVREGHTRIGCDLNNRMLGRCGRREQEREDPQNWQQPNILKALPPGVTGVLRTRWALGNSLAGGIPAQAPQAVSQSPKKFVSNFATERSHLHPNESEG